MIENLSGQPQAPISEEFRNKPWKCIRHGSQTFDQLHVVVSSGEGTVWCPLCFGVKGAIPLYHEISVGPIRRKA